MHTLNRRSFFLSTLAVAASLCAGPALAQAGKLAESTVVARVGEASITHGALKAQLLKYYGKTAVEQLVDRSVLRQEGARYQVAVTDAEIDARVATLKKGVEARFQEALDAAGLTPDGFREQVRYTLLAEKVLKAKWPVRPQDLVKLTFRYARLRTDREAKTVIQEARNGVDFAFLVLQRSMDKRNGGLYEKILRIDNPAMYRLASEANLRVNQVSPQPIPAGGSYIVLKLEGVSDPAQTSAAERERDTQRIYAFRMMGLMPSSRKRYKIEAPAVVSLPAADAKPEDGVAKVGAESITRKALLVHLFDYFGRGALEQLVDRSGLTQEAARLGVKLTEAELNARVEETKKAAGSSFAETALGVEGITEDAWRERLRYVVLAEKVVDAKAPAGPEDLQRLTVRFVRANNRADAEAILKQIQSGAMLEQIAQQRMLTTGILQPRAFLRVEVPSVFKAITEASLAPGQVLEQPVQLANAWLVVKLEGRFGPETMTIQERQAALRKLRSSRMDGILNGIRKQYAVEYRVPIQALAAEARA